MASILTSYWTTSSCCCCGAHSSSSSNSSSNSSTEHLPAASTTPGTCCCNNTGCCSTLPACYLSVIRKRANLTSVVLWRGLRMHISIPRSQFLKRHTRDGRGCNARSEDTSCHEISPAVPSGPNHGQSVKSCCLGHGDANECPLSAHDGTKGLLRHLHKGHETQ